MFAVGSLSLVWLFVTPWTVARQVSLSITISWSLLKLMSIELVMPSNHLILCHPLLILPSIFPSIRVFSNESVLHIRWSKYWSFSISPSNGYSGLISFRIDGFDLLAVQGTLKSLLQHHSSKALILRHSAFFIVQLSHPYMLLLSHFSRGWLCEPTDCSLPGSSVHGILQGKNTRVGCHALLQGIFPTQGSNSRLPHCRQMLYLLSHQVSPMTNLDSILKSRDITLPTKVCLKLWFF